ncbi:MAG: ABC transporter permease [Anaerolineales bacterium]
MLQKIVLWTHKRTSNWQEMPDWLSSLLVILLAFLIGALFIIAIGASPLAAYGALLRAAFGSVNGFAETMIKACPLLLAGLGISLAYRAQFWNIGAEGQIYAGGVCAAIVGLYLHGLPAFAHITLTLLAGMIGGALLGFFPALFKVRLGVNEMITTLMLNYVVIQAVAYLLHGPLRDQASGITISPQLLKSAWLPIVVERTRFHLGVLLAIGLALLIHWFIYRTVLGYQIRASGENRRAARVGGIRVNWVIIWTVLLSSALAGLAGAVEVSGVQHRLVEDFSPGYGYLAIAVALLGNLEPVRVIFSSILFAALLNGADAMQRAAAVPVPVIYVIEGVVIVLVAVSIFRRKGSL